jgi:hypothetical protein
MSRNVAYKQVLNRKNVAETKNAGKSSSLNATTSIFERFGLLDI